MSKKINLKSMNLDDLNKYLVSCKKLQDEDARYKEEKAPLEDALNKKKAERIRLEKEGLSSDNVSILEEQKALDKCKSDHQTINKGINAEIREVTKKYCPKEDDMYNHYATISGSKDFAKDILAILKSFGAKVNNEKKGAEQVAHITGWRQDKKAGCMKPVSRATFTNMIFLGITTMLTEGDDKALCVRNDDGSLTWKRDLEEKAEN